MVNTPEVNNSISAEEMRKEVGVFNINQNIECELTPEGMAYVRQSDLFEVVKFGLKGNRLNIQLWRFASLFWTTFSMCWPQYIKDNNIVLFREKTIDEIRKDYGDRFESTLKKSGSKEAVSDKDRVLMETIIDKSTAKKPKDGSLIIKKPKRPRD